LRCCAIYRRHGLLDALLGRRKLSRAWASFDLR